MLTFYYSTQTCSTAVHIALEEAELPFHGIEVSWKRKLNLTELEAVNPLGQVPVIVDNGQMLNQTIAILPYIAALAPGKNLFPKEGSWERTKALSWLAFIGTDLQKNFTPIVRASRWTKDITAQTDIKKSAKETIQAQLSYINNSLASNEYVLGNQFTMVDAYLFTIVGWCKWAEIDLSTHGTLLNYMKRIYQRPAVQKVLTKEDMLAFF